MTKKIEVVECQHDEQKVYQINAGPTLVFRICEICYAQIYMDVSQEVFRQMARGAINKTLKDSRI